jgi:prepilin-type N-terminal cleavage/methylation domain-containing protein
MYISQLNRERGFTLIELLVVIAIIGILASVVLASLNSARQKSRDARRISDVQQIKLGLELYFDQAGTYPSGGVSSGNPELESELAGNNFMASFPEPPSGAGQDNYSYAPVNPSGGGQCTSYHLGASLENSEHNSLDNDSDEDSTSSGPLTTAGSGECNDASGNDDTSAYGSGFNGVDGSCAESSGSNDTCYDIRP